MSAISSSNLDNIIMVWAHPLFHMWHAFWQVLRSICLHPTFLVCLPHLLTSWSLLVTHQFNSSSLTAVYWFVSAAPLLNTPLLSAAYRSSSLPIIQQLIFAWTSVVRLLLLGNLSLPTAEQVVCAHCSVVHFTHYSLDRLCLLLNSLVLFESPAASR